MAQGTARAQTLTAVAAWSASKFCGSQAQCKNSLSVYPDASLHRKDRKARIFFTNTLFNTSLADRRSSFVHPYRTLVIPFSSIFLVPLCSAFTCLVLSARFSFSILHTSFSTWPGWALDCICIVIVRGRKSNTISSSNSTTLADDLKVHNRT